MLPSGGKQVTAHMLHIFARRHNHLSKHTCPQIIRLSWATSPTSVTRNVHTVRTWNPTHRKRCCGIGAPTKACLRANIMSGANMSWDCTGVPSEGIPRKHTTSGNRSQNRFGTGKNTFFRHAGRTQRWEDLNSVLSLVPSGCQDH